MNISEDVKICEKIIEEYKKLTPEDVAGAFKLSQLSLSMYDRLNEIRFQVKMIEITEKKTKTDVKEYLRGKMKVMEYIHVESRAIFNSAQNDSNRFKRY